MIFVWINHIQKQTTEFNAPYHHPEILWSLLRCNVHSLGCNPTHYCSVIWLQNPSLVTEHKLNIAGLVNVYIAGKITTFSR